MRSRRHHAFTAAGPSRIDVGFTVIEIIIAVALSALLLTVVYYTYFSIDRSIGAATEDQDAFETGRILSELIKKDIRGISPSRSVLMGILREPWGHTAPLIGSGPGGDRGREAAPTYRPANPGA